MTVLVRSRTKTDGAGQTLFFIGCSSIPMARHFERVMISANRLRKRKSDFQVREWMFDSAAFTELARFGCYRHDVGEYARQVNRWRQNGQMLCAVSQDWMCEPFVLKRTGLSVAEHQRLTIERYDALRKLTTAPLMPVLQGYRVSDYLTHMDSYGQRLQPGQWVGVGSLCKRNARPSEISDVLASIKNKRPDLRLHGFGVKLTALESRDVRALLHSCDSSAWSYPARFGCGDGSLETANEYLKKVEAALAGAGRNRTPPTAGAGNGQGRKPKWKHMPTTAIRVPAEFADDLLKLAREWDAPQIGEAEACRMWLELVDGHTPAAVSVQNRMSRHDRKEVER